MNSFIKKYTLYFVTGLVLIYLSVFFSSYITYVVLSFYYLLQKDMSVFQHLLWLSLVGLSLSLLATLCAWPFALSMAIFIEQNKSRLGVAWLHTFIKFLGSMPLVLFAYLFLEVVGVNVFNVLQSFWVENFASSNLLTQSLAFALTLLLFPLTIFPFFLEKMSVDLFFKSMLSAVIEFAEVGLVSSVMILGLMAYTVPQIVLRMLKYLEQDKSKASHEVIQSLGGTHWEGIYMTVLQSMKEYFNMIIIRFTRVCFFEGILTLSLLSFFFREQERSSSYWGATLSSSFVLESIGWRKDINNLIIFSGFMVFYYILLTLLETFFRRKHEATHA